MNTSIRIAFALGAAAAVLSSASASPTAEEIMARNFLASKVADSTTEVTFHLRNAVGQERIRLTAGPSKLIPGTTDNRRLITFNAPADVKGTKTLLIEHSDGDDDIWIYLPAMKKVRRLVASNKRDPFVGTDFSYGDVIGHKVGDWRHRLIKEEKAEGKDCYVVESVPKSPAVQDTSGYSKRVSWVDKKSWIALRVDIYDSAGELLKRISAEDVQEVDVVNHKWQPMKQTAANLQTGHRRSSNSRISKPMLASATICFPRGLWRIERVAIGLLASFITAYEARCDAAARWKEALGLSGTARVSFFTKDNTFVDNPGVQCDSIWITAEPREVVGTKTYFDARIQGQFVTGNSKIRGDLREGYAEWSVRDLDLKFGRQITVWGRADKINPTDSWSVRNYRLLATDDDDQRSGALELQATWNFANQRLIAVWQPEFRTPVLPIPPQQENAPLAMVIAGPKANQAGVKLDHSGTGVDWSVSYVHAINRTPDLTLLGNTPNKWSRVGLAYNFAEVIGADAAVPIGKFGFRGEVAYVHARNRGGRDLLAQNDRLFVVVGAERTWNGKLNVNIQYLFKRAFDYRQLARDVEPVARSLDQQARLIHNQLAPTMSGASFRINYKALNETLETELSGAMWFKKLDSFVMLKVSYAFTDRVKGIVGADVWSGPADSFFGRLRSTSTLFVEFRFGL